jgi:hypothetical protein
MAPAIAHFLVGASLLLVGTIPFTLRGDIDREDTLLVVPLGGIWGIVPDFHHIAPVGRDTLYAFHNSAWVEVFALHYTLDRTTIRLLYHESVFASIALFTLSVAVVWITGRIRDSDHGVQQPRDRLFVRAGATLLAAGFATFVLGVSLSIQQLLPAIAALHGETGVLAGGLFVLLYGFGFGICEALGLEWLLSETALRVPLRAGTAAAGGGGVVWLGGVVVGIPILGGGTIPLLHWGALVSLVLYGGVFGSVYAAVRGAFL